MVTKELIILAVLGCLLNKVESQMLEQTGLQTDSGDVIEVSEDMVLDEDSDNAAMSRILGIDSIDQFLDLLVDDNGAPISTDALFSPYPSEGNNKTVINGGGRMAVSDECSPRKVTVELPLPDNDANAVFYPKCTKMERCGGCCPTRHLECVPAYTERVSLKVIKAVAPFPGSPHLRYSGFSSVIVDRHVRCRVNCTLNREKCGENKRFVRTQCVCKCRFYKRCRPPLQWNPETCDCECVGGVRQCCPNGDECGLRFNKQTCQCTLNVHEGQYVGNSINISDEAIAAWEQNNTFALPRQGDMMQEAPAPTTTPPPPTTPSTTTTTTEPVPVDPCATVPCPRNFIKIAQNGHCVCRPQNRYPVRHGHGRPRGRGRGRG